MQLVVSGFLSAAAASSLGTLGVSVLVHRLPAGMLERAAESGRFGGLGARAPFGDGGPRAGRRVPLAFALAGAR